MAKCVQVVGQGIPVRMTDDEAFQWVERDRDGQYCSKSLWRQGSDPARSVALGRLSAGKPKSNYLDLKAA